MSSLLLLLGGCESSRIPSVARSARVAGSSEAAQAVDTSEQENTNPGTIHYVQKFNSERGRSVSESCGYE